MLSYVLYLCELEMKTKTATATTTAKRKPQIRLMVNFKNLLHRKFLNRCLVSWSSSPVTIIARSLPYACFSSSSSSSSTDPRIVYGDHTVETKTNTQQRRSSGRLHWASARSTFRFLIVCLSCSFQSVHTNDKWTLL